MVQIEDRHDITNRSFTVKTTPVTEAEDGGQNIIDVTALTHNDIFFGSGTGIQL